jgi:hypothetical protein
MLTLNHKFQACAEFSPNFLEWIVCNPEAFRQLLFRNPDQVVYNNSALVLILAFNKAKLGSLEEEIIKNIMEIAGKGEQKIHSSTVGSLPQLFEKVLKFIEDTLMSRGTNDGVAY